MNIGKKLAQIVAWFVGSWWGVIFHTVWFTIWLIYKFDLNLLMVAVSLEAIFIGIFVLMASNEAEIERDKREAAAQKRATMIIERILDLEHKLAKQQQQILKLLTENAKRS